MFSHMYALEKIPSFYVMDLLFDCFVNYTMAFHLKTLHNMDEVSSIL